MTKKVAVTAPPRPPIVTIMGHVDHGKTTLLDTIRHTRVALGEVGGITQHVAAYQVDYQGHKITFIDTPGHAAFAAMRARGANVTDVVVLVIAGTEGVKPQTIESIKHIQKAAVPFVVAINKKDQPGFSADMVKAQLTEHGVFCEGYGGQIPSVDISAAKNEGIDQLLEIISLLAQLEGLISEPEASLEAPIIESHLDKHRGHLATVIVRRGTLTPGSTIYVGNKAAKIRALFIPGGQALKSALPGDPAEVMGFTFLPTVGSVLTQNPVLPAPLAPPPPAPLKTPTPETEVDPNPEKPPRVNVILKADTMGTLEAIIDSVAQEELVVVDQGVGAVTEADIILAHNTGSGIIAFSVPITQGAKNLAKIEHVRIQSFSIIYKLIEFLEKEILTLLEPSIFEEELGLATIKQIFQIRGASIAGCEINSGRLSVKDSVHLLRSDRTLATGKIVSLKSGAVDAKTLEAPEGCGVVIEPKVDFKVGDVIKSYKLVERA